MPPMTRPDGSTRVISVIMPVHNGALTLGRAAASVLRQTFTDWELLAVEDSSTDGSRAVLLDWAERDSRVRVLSTLSALGPGGARNLALCVAHGAFIAYLDCDDEFYPDYLESIHRFRGLGNVLVFQYDYEPYSPICGGKVRTWDPRRLRDRLFMTNISVPLGIAHRRSVLTKAGVFDTRPWFGEDWDLWKRMARSGAQFVFLPLKSGLYHSEPGSLSHSYRTTQAQRDQYESGRRGHDRLFHNATNVNSRRIVERLAFASAHTIVDPSSGAAVATSEALQLLSGSGLRCEAFTAATLDFPEEVCVEELLTTLGVPYDVRTLTGASESSRVLLTRNGNVPVAIFRNRFTRCGPVEARAGGLCHGLRAVLT